MKKKNTVANHISRCLHSPNQYQRKFLQV